MNFLRARKAMQDTVARAILFRSHQDYHEAEVYCGEAGELLFHESECTKHPGHTQYITRDKFNVNSLPLSYRDELIANFIRALSDVTVRVVVDHTSSGRPPVYHRSGNPYPFAEDEGKDMKRTGTGWLRKVTMFSTDVNSGTCPCKECLSSASPSKEWWEIVIRTAAHVVSDDEEGRHTVCSFFFDYGFIPHLCNGAIQLSGTVRVVSETDGDWSDLVFVIHNKEVAEKLDRMLKLYPELNLKIWDMYPAEDPNRAEELNLAVIVSHPHGLSKRISIGSVQQRDIVSSNNDTRYTHTTPTCRGSSGAPLYILGKSRRWQWCSHPHSGYSPAAGLSFSGHGKN